MQDIDTDIIIQASDGNIEAFEQLYRQVSPFVYTVVLRIVNNEADANDVIQDVFIKVYKKSRHLVISRLSILGYTGLR